MQIHLKNRKSILKKCHKKMQSRPKMGLTPARVRHLRKFRLFYKSMRHLEYTHDTTRTFMLDLFGVNDVI